MNGIEGIIEYIKLQSAAECEAITAEAAQECERIRTEYARTEQDEYWKYLGIGAKETEQRLAQLNDLAEQEAKKQVFITQQEMVEAAFTLAAGKINELPGEEYSGLLEKLGVESDCGAEALVGRYKEELYAEVMAALFD